jgi:hypothetical protein
MTVRLHNDGRCFTCPFCRRVGRFPPFDIFFCPDAHAYCEFCGRCMKVENFKMFKSEGEFDAWRRGEDISL